MKKATAASLPKVTADEKLWRIDQVKASLAAYDGKQLPLDPDEVDHIVELLNEWAALADIWPNLTIAERDKQWMTSIFPALIRAARAELTRVADWIEKNTPKLIGKRHSSIQGRESERIAYRVSRMRMAAMWDGARKGAESLVPMIKALADSGCHPECIWARIMYAAYSVTDDPGKLSDLKLAELRGDLLMAIAELNRSMFLAVRPYAEGDLAAGRKQAKHAKEGGNALRIPAVVEDEWKKEAKRVLLKHPDWKGKSRVAREVAKATSGSYDTIRQRPWLAELMKSD